MHRRIPPEKKRAFRERLQREATESRPVFSEALHQQIVSAVKQHGDDNRVRPRVTKRVVRLLAAALAVACVLTAVMFGWPIVQRSMQQGVWNEDANAGLASGAPAEVFPLSVSIADLSTLDALTGDARENLDELITLTAVAPQSAALKHDIRLAAEVLMERLPVNVELLAGP